MRDDATAPRVVMISETLARRLWPGESPLGKRISCCSEGEPLWREVVGTVGPVRHFGLAAEAEPEMYLPFWQAPPESWSWNDRAMSLVVRAADPAALAPVLRGAVHSVDRSLPVYGVRTLEEVVARTHSTARFHTLLLMGLADTGLVLAVGGIYGVISYLVTQRTHEIGVRMALGATTADVMRLAMREGVEMGGVGLVIGLAAPVGAARVLRALLFGVTTTDPILLAASCAMLFAAERSWRAIYPRDAQRASKP